MNSERAAWLSRTPKVELARMLRIGAWAVSALVLILVGLMRRPEMKVDLPEGWSFAYLPPFHATVNALVALALVGAFIAIMSGNVRWHRGLIITAMALSGVFLLSYVAYHFTSVETRFGDLNGDGRVDPSEAAAVGGKRVFYLILLISHIVLAAVSLPFILFTFISGWTNQFVKHRRMARWVFPVWLYVALTGPICYWMLRPYY